MNLLHLNLIAGNHNLSATLDRNSLVRAFFAQHFVANSRQSGLERIGGVIKTGMQYTAVPPTAMHRKLLFSLENDNLEIRSQALNANSNTKAHNSASDDGNVWCFESHVLASVNGRHVQGARHDKLS